MSIEMLPNSPSVDQFNTGGQSYLVNPSTFVAGDCGIEGTLIGCNRTPICCLSAAYLLPMRGDCVVNFLRVQNVDYSLWESPVS